MIPGLTIDIDSSGNIFVAGYTEGPLDGNTNAGSSDIFLTKWNANGTKAWTKQWGTTGIDYARGLAVDAGGNIFVTGHTAAALDNNISYGNTDIFLTKWNADGTKSWTKQWGTGENDVGFGISIANDGNLFISGHTYGSLDNNQYVGLADIMVAKLSPGGVKIWTSQWGTVDTNYSEAVTVDSTGKIYACGTTGG